MLYTALLLMLLDAKPLQFRGSGDRTQSDNIEKYFGGAPPAGSSLLFDAPYP